MEHCKGCLSYKIDVDGEEYHCHESQYNDVGQCPCSKCIVKMMCDVPCSDHFDFKIDQKVG